MKKLIYLVIGGVIAFSLFYAFSGGESLEAYQVRLDKQRTERVRFLKNASDSPFKNHPKSADSLSFFPTDVSFKVLADIDILEEKNYLSLKTNTGENQKFLKYGYARFDVKEISCKLLLLRPIGEKKILVVFADETSGSETYGGGRYVDLALNQLETMTIDFNMAYNPYCAYNGNYSCPIPPRENILPIPILAGEKNY